MDYSIIIPAYNEEKYISIALESVAKAVNEIFSSKKLDGEIIVVDNNSNDKTAEIGRAYGANVVFEPVNCIARARNKGAESALGKYLIFIDADTSVPADLVEATLDRMLSGTYCGGGAYVGFEKDFRPFLPRIIAGIWNWAVSLYPVAAGSYLFCLRDAWLETGGFDETYFASEELYFSREIRKWGEGRGMKFGIISIKVMTSSRKFRDYSVFELFVKFFSLLINPRRLKNKKYCSVWYERR